MTDNNLIPFTKELWETGEYEVEPWNGEEAVDSPLIMLRKKTKKVWVPVFKTDVSLKEYYLTKEECEMIYGSDLLVAIEVEI